VRMVKARSKPRRVDRVSQLAARHPATCGSWRVQDLWEPPTT
jgi:hypothetical protein